MRRRRISEFETHLFCGVLFGGKRIVTDRTRLRCDVGRCTILRWLCHHRLHRLVTAVTQRERERLRERERRRSRRARILGRWVARELVAKWDTLASYTVVKQHCHRLFASVDFRDNARVPSVRGGAGSQKTQFELMQNNAPKAFYILPLASHEKDRLHFARFPERVRAPFSLLMTNIHMVLLMFLS